eukprot:TRINITY_DN1624_c0_g2_i26.p1 TRINITY_DN1624_c0_g2~~TRINITY_DN1624_c0_g2_i26.p1  ORF type:complete len:217 (+),score=46.51 TRINITY_DN1624_c0_g2_i26:91-651(+)
MEFRPVCVAGNYDFSCEQFIYPRVLEGTRDVGMHVITPFTRSNGDRILINRGWIPLQQKHSTVDGQTDGEITVCGLVRKPENKKPSYFTPENEPAKNMWYWLDLNSMAKATYALPVIIDKIAVNSSQKNGSTSDFTPIPGQTPIQLRNQHLGYAITWFSLSFFLCLMAKRFVKGPPPMLKPGLRRW